MYFYVYLICTKTKNGKLISYVGYTNNIQNRLSLHNNSKGARFTRGRSWKLLYKKKFSLKNNALKYEYVLKKDRNMRELIKKKY
tara:strand:- start:353 stop:604 length:252 start_codon:yes stop_codon:yes gene_type:complete